MAMDLSKSPTNRKLGWWWGFVAQLTAALPWWRNHGFIRDFMDYGLVMTGAGRFGDGEAPDVDFVTPIQAGFLYLNRWMEVLGGGTFIGMTYGGTPVDRRRLVWAAALAEATRRHFGSRSDRVGDHRLLR